MQGDRTLLALWGEAVCSVQGNDAFALPKFPARQRRRRSGEGVTPRHRALDPMKNNFPFVDLASSEIGLTEHPHFARLEWYFFLLMLRPKDAERMNHCLILIHKLLGENPDGIDTRYAFRNFYDFFSTRWSLQAEDLGDASLAMSVESTDGGGGGAGKEGSCFPALSTEMQRAYQSHAWQPNHRNRFSKSRPKPVFDEGERIPKGIKFGVALRLAMALDQRDEDPANYHYDQLVQMARCVNEDRSPNFLERLWLWLCRLYARLFQSSEKVAYYTEKALIERRRRAVFDEQVQGFDSQENLWELARGVLSSAQNRSGKEGLKALMQRLGDVQGHQPYRYRILERFAFDLGFELLQSAASVWPSFQRAFIGVWNREGSERAQQNSTKDIWQVLLDTQDKPLLWQTFLREFQRAWPGGGKVVCWWRLKDQNIRSAWHLLQIIMPGSSVIEAALHRSRRVLDWPGVEDETFHRAIMLYCHAFWVSWRKAGVLRGRMDAEGVPEEEQEAWTRVNHRMRFLRFPPGVANEFAGGGDIRVEGVDPVLLPTSDSQHYADRLRVALKAWLEGRDIAPVSLLDATGRFIDDVQSGSAFWVVSHAVPADLLDTPQGAQEIDAGGGGGGGGAAADSIETKRNAGGDGTPQTPGLNETLNL